ncbi:hypothetical protein D0862_06400 [Hortaea werneckii]|uniref:F-box domain-containing protein n=1 Tax=Hortaea werneckii TaxID=91943 RepID=A0A3M7GJG5_HORWE|nr:hypothetical protein D0862_06400 [Hortaea werneckii]
MALLQLPPELLLRTSDHLTTSELGYLRLTCKAIESTLFDTFAKEFFTKRQFMVEHVSLQALLDIASHPTLSPWLTQIIIGADMLPPFPDIAHLPSCARHRYLERRVFLSTGLACEMLAEAFSKLSNLQTVGLRDYHGGPAGSGRERDGPDASWKSYGWSCNLSEEQYQSRTHLWRPSTTAWGHPGPLLPLILQALGRAKARPQNLEIFLRKGNKLDPWSFNVFNCRLAPSIPSILAGIQRLMLSISDLNRSSNNSGKDSIETRMRSVPIIKFLEHTSDLKCLRLNFQGDTSNADHILEWLGRRPEGSSLENSNMVAYIPPVQLDNLVELDLGMVSIHNYTLVDIVTKFSLKSLNLWKVSIKALKNPAGGGISSLWPSFFTTVADKLISNTLQSVMVGWPASREYEQDASRLDFKNMRFVIDGDHDNCKPENVTHIVKYQAVFGSNIKDWLRETAAKFVTLEHVEGPFSGPIGNDSEDDELLDEFDESSEGTDDGGEIEEMSDEEDD